MRWGSSLFLRSTDVVRLKHLELGVQDYGKMTLEKWQEVVLRKGEAGKEGGNKGVAVERLKRMNKGADLDSANLHAMEIQKLERIKHLFATSLDWLS
jgi:hypothetical protein